MIDCSRCSQPLEPPPLTVEKGGLVHVGSKARGRDSVKKEPDSDQSPPRRPIEREERRRSRSRSRSRERRRDYDSRETARRDRDSDRDRPRHRDRDGDSDVSRTHKDRDSRRFGRDDGDRKDVLPDVDAVLNGTVRTLKPFGVFVTLDGKALHSLIGLLLIKAFAKRAWCTYRKWQSSEWKSPKTLSAQVSVLKCWC